MPQLKAYLITLLPYSLSRRLVNSCFYELLLSYSPAPDIMDLQSNRFALTLYAVWVWVRVCLRLSALFEYFEEAVRNYINAFPTSFSSSTMIEDASFQLRSTVVNFKDV